jgi:hypothetical protein
MVKPTLKMFPTPPTVEPPSTLGETGRDLWSRVMGAYAIADVGGQELLFQACAAADRAESLRKQIARDGEIIGSSTGMLRDHPAIKHELAARAFVVRTLHRLGLDVEPVRSGAGRPGYGGIGWRGGE